MQNFTLFVDESGEAGINKVRGDGQKGASPYFVLGAVLSQPAQEICAGTEFEAFRNHIGKASWKHATDLDHSEKVLLARTLGGLPLRYFAVVSFKKTLGDYKDQIEENPQKYYNKCTKYLLECVCDYLLRNGFSDFDLRVIFERRNHDYDAMIRYLSKVKENPIYEQSKVLEKFNPFAITSLPKGENVMLEIADFVAHAVYQCSNKSQHNFDIPEPRYFVEMSSRFAGNSKFEVLGSGLKFIQGIDQVGLDADVRDKITLAKSKPASR